MVGQRKYKVMTDKNTHCTDRISHRQRESRILIHEVMMRQDTPGLITNGYTWRGNDKDYKTITGNYS